MSTFHALDELDSILRKAQAMAYVTWGESGEPFRRLNDQAQDYFMWQLSDLLGSAIKLLEADAAATTTKSP